MTMTACYRTPYYTSESKPMSDLPNPLPVPSTGPVNRITPQEGNGATPTVSSTPAIPQTISTVEDCLAFLAAQFSCVVIGVTRKRVGSAPNAKPASVTVLHAGDPGEAIRLAQVAAGTLQGA